MMTITTELKGLLKNQLFCSKSRRVKNFTAGHIIDIGVYTTSEDKILNTTKRLGEKEII